MIESGAFGILGHANCQLGRSCKACKKELKSSRSLLKAITVTRSNGMAGCVIKGVPPDPPGGTPEIRHYGLHRRFWNINSGDVECVIEI